MKTVTTVVACHSSLYTLCTLLHLYSVSLTPGAMFGAHVHTIRITRIAATAAEGIIYIISSKVTAAQTRAHGRQNPFIRVTRDMVEKRIQFLTARRITRLVASRRRDCVVYVQINTIKRRTYTCFVLYVQYTHIYIPRLAHLNPTRWLFIFFFNFSHTVHHPPFMRSSGTYSHSPSFG